MWTVNKTRLSRDFAIKILIQSIWNKSKIHGKPTCKKGCALKLPWLPYPRFDSISGLNRLKRPPQAFAGCSTWMATRSSPVSANILQHNKSKLIWIIPYSNRWSKWWIFVFPWTILARCTALSRDFLNFITTIIVIGSQITTSKCKFPALVRCITCEISEPNLLSYFFYWRFHGTAAPFYGCFYDFVSTLVRDLRRGNYVETDGLFVWQPGHYPFKILRVLSTVDGESQLTNLYLIILITFRISVFGSPDLFLPPSQFSVLGYQIYCYIPMYLGTFAL